MRIPAETRHIRSDKTHLHILVTNNKDNSISLCMCRPDLGSDRLGTSIHINSQPRRPKLLDALP